MYQDKLAREAVEKVIAQDQLNADKVLAIAATTKRYAGTSVKVNLHRRGVFRNSVIGACHVSLQGDVSISSETALTQERLCVSHYELMLKDVLAMRPLRSRETDFELHLELSDITWTERTEKLPLPGATHSISRTAIRRPLLREGSPRSGEC
jgi:hypothetical protein